MPVNNKRSYSNNGSSRNNGGGSGRSNGNYGGRSGGRGNASAGRGRGGSFKAKAKDAFNMLNLLTAFGDIVEWGGNEPTRIKVRALLKTKDGEFINPMDEQENEYDMEEAVRLLAAALLEGKGINFYLFLNDDGSYGGNGRIDIKGIEIDGEDEDEEEEVEEEPAPKRKTAKATGKAPTQAKKKSPTSTTKKRNYEEDIRKQEVDEEDESDEEIEVDESLPM